MAPEGERGGRAEQQQQIGRGQQYEREREALLALKPRRRDELQCPGDRGR